MTHVHNDQGKCIRVDVDQTTLDLYHQLCETLDEIDNRADLTHPNSVDAYAKYFEWAQKEIKPFLEIKDPWSIQRIGCLFECCKTINKVMLSIEPFAL